MERATDFWREGDDHPLLPISLLGQMVNSIRQRNLALEQQSQHFDILWFKLADSPRFEAENVFYSSLWSSRIWIVSGVGGHQVGWALHEDAP